MTHSRFIRSTLCQRTVPTLKFGETTSSTQLNEEKRDKDLCAMESKILYLPYVFCSCNMRNNGMTCRSFPIESWLQNSRKSDNTRSAILPLCDQSKRFIENAVYGLPGNALLRLRYRRISNGKWMTGKICPNY